MTTPITDAGGSTPSDEVVKRVKAALLDAFWNGDPNTSKVERMARAAIAAMPAPSAADDATARMAKTLGADFVPKAARVVDPVEEVGEMIALLRNDLEPLKLSSRWVKSRETLTIERREAATLLQQLADDNARLTKMLTMEDS